MLTVEIKINGTLVKHIYGHNVDGYEESTYDIVIADTVPLSHTKPSITTKTIKHTRDDGIAALVIKALEGSDE